MKFQPDQASRHFINGFGQGWVMVNGEKFTHSVLVSSEAGVVPWPVSHPTAIDEQAFAAVAQMDTEIVLYGSGDTLVFPNPRHTMALMQRRIGVETMDTPAACRTFNVLAGEGRKVTAALII